MYEHLLDTCGIVFEGRPEPIFYQGFYPTYGDWDDECWAEHDYVRNLKRESDDEIRNFCVRASEYAADLRRMLVAAVADTPNARRRGVVAIPSSNANVVNAVTDLVRKVLQSEDAPNADDLTAHLVRTRTKEKDHKRCGTRSADENIDTLAFDVPEGGNAYDVIIVVDDVVTSGKSFFAVGTVLRRAGFRGTIINLAFARTMTATALVQMRSPGESRERFPDATIDAIVFDLDQTLLDDFVLEPEFEREPKDYRNPDGKGGSIPYRLFPGANRLRRMRVPFAVLSNSRRRRLRWIMTDWSICHQLGLRRYASGELGYNDLPEHVFNAPQAVDGSRSYPLSKPCPDGVCRAINHLIPDEERQKTARVVGLGNTLEDMLAYNAAGVESCLALWGMPAWLRDAARCKWHAAHAFESLNDFFDWIQAQGAKDADDDCPFDVTDSSDGDTPFDAYDPDCDIPFLLNEGDEEGSSPSDADDDSSSRKADFAFELDESSPSLSKLIKEWKEEDATNELLLKEFSAHEGNLILERAGYLMKGVHGEWVVTELGQRAGIVARRERLSNGLCTVIRYSEHGASVVRGVILAKLRGEPMRNGAAEPHSTLAIDQDEDVPFSA